jgi:hypothetical protein
MTEKILNFGTVVGAGASNTINWTAVLDDVTGAPNVATNLHVALERPLGSVGNVDGRVMAIPVGPVTVAPAGPPAQVNGLDVSETQSADFQVTPTGAPPYWIILAVWWQDPVTGAVMGGPALALFPVP